MTITTGFMSRHCGLPEMKNERGFSLIELLITMIISSIAMMALAVPFMAERSMWATGRQQAAAQRDAQMALRTMARVAREGNNYVINANSITFTTPCGTKVFQTAGNSSQQFEMVDNCAAPSQTVTLIDGTRSRVTQFNPTAVTTRLVQIQFQITNEGQENEQLQTQLFLRNA